MIIPKSIFSKFLLIVIISLGSATVGLWIKANSQQAALNNFWNRLNNATNTINQLGITNDAQSEVIEQLRTMREQDSEAFNKLLQESKNRDAVNSNIRQQLNELKKRDTDAQVYMDTIIPNTIASVLNNTDGNTNYNSAAGNTGNAARVSVSTVPDARSAGNSNK